MNRILPLHLNFAMELPPLEIKSTPAFLNGPRLEGTEGGPPKLEVGTAHASVPHNISRSSVIGCERKYELSKKRCHQEIFSEIRLKVFLVKKKPYMLYITF